MKTTTTDPPMATKPSKPEARTGLNKLRRLELPRAMPTLRFTPTAWAKLLHLRDKSNCEVGGFGICETDDLLLVTDLTIPAQSVTAASVEFDDESVADHFDQQIDLGRRPQQFARIWVHTHPGNSAEPSVVDEECFERVFGRSDWALMFILAPGGKTFARMRFNTGPGGDVAVPVEVDYSAEFPASDHAAWTAEYEQNVRRERIHSFGPKDAAAPESLCFDDDWLADLGEMDPDERQAVLCDLYSDPEAWG